MTAGVLAFPSGYLDTAICIDAVEGALAFRTGATATLATMRVAGDKPAISDFDVAGVLRKADPFG